MFLPLRYSVGCKTFKHYPNNDQASKYFCAGKVEA